MTKYRIHRMKEEIRQLLHLTRPPRLEGAVKEAMMQPERKEKRMQVYKPA